MQNQSATMRGILIDPALRSIRVVDVPTDTYKRIPEALGCDYMEHVTIGEHDDLWIDEEGALVQPNPHGYFRAGGRVYAGRGLILSHDDEGNSTSTTRSVMEVSRVVSFVAFDNIPDEVRHPRMTVAELGPDLRPVPGSEVHYPIDVRKADEE